MGVTWQEQTKQRRRAPRTPGKKVPGGQGLSPEAEQEERTLEYDEGHRAHQENGEREGCGVWLPHGVLGDAVWPEGRAGTEDRSPPDLEVFEGERGPRAPRGRTPTLPPLRLPSPARGVL